MHQLFLDTVYPIRCVHCDSPSKSSTLCLCYTCTRQLRTTRRDLVTDIVGIDRSVNSVLSHTCSLWYYSPRSPARTLQHRLKYGGRRDLCGHLGRLLANRALATVPSKDLFDCVVPIPLHKVRLLDRGYNQASEIASGVSDVLAVPLVDTSLIRTEFSHSQTGKSRRDRERSLSGAFCTTPKSTLRGNRVLLIDDVITTGSTIRSALATLRRSGAVEIGVWTLFAVPPVQSIALDIDHIHIT